MLCKRKYVDCELFIQNLLNISVAKSKENIRKGKKETTLVTEIVETFLGRRDISDLHDISLQKAELKAED